MSDTLDWICGQLGVSRGDITSNRRDDFIVTRRRIISYFFNHYQKGSLWISKLLHKHWTSVTSMLQTIKECEMIRALELSKKYEDEIVGMDITELCLDRIVQKKIEKREVIKVVCSHFNVVESDIFGHCRTKNVADAKKVIYYVFRKSGMTFYDIARFVNKGHQTIVQIVNRMDDPELIEYGDLIYDLYCSENIRERRKEILRLVNEGKSVHEIYTETAYAKEFIKNEIDNFIVKKVPDYHTGAIKIKYFEKN